MPLAYVRLVILALSAAATPALASGCGFNCDKCGKYRDPFGTKQCSYCCWGDLSQDLAKVGCDVVGNVGGKAYVAAAGVMASRAGGAAEKFSEEEKAILRACHGGLLDVANLYFGVPPMDSIDLGVGGYKWRNEGSTAQTFGGRIYFAQPRSAVDLSTMSHEMYHVQQWDKHGRDLGRMGEKYMRGFCDAGFNYRGNTFEAEAYADEYKCSGQRILLKNGCTKSKMLVALRYSVAGKWKSQGFWTLKPGESVLAATTDNKIIYPWARLEDSSEVWYGQHCYKLHGDPKICGTEVQTKDYPNTYTSTFVSCSTCKPC